MKTLFYLLLGLAILPTSAFSSGDFQETTFSDFEKFLSDQYSKEHKKAKIKDEKGVMFSTELPGISVVVRYTEKSQPLPKDTRDFLEWNDKVLGDSRPFTLMSVVGNEAEVKELSTQQRRKILIQKVLEKEFVESHQKGYDIRARLRYLGYSKNQFRYMLVGYDDLDRAKSPKTNQLLGRKNRRGK